ncbi:MAG: zf-TFIIB domain-containing protein [Polyangiaceae bacterium]
MRRCPTCELEGEGTSPYRASGGEQKREHVPLVEERVPPTGITVDRCPECRGVYLDHRELERLEDAARGSRFVGLVTRALSQGRRPEDELAERPARQCPACGEEMFEREWRASLVNIDVCLGCRGIWLDGGELESLTGDA